LQARILVLRFVVISYLIDPSRFRTVGFVEVDANAVGVESIKIVNAPPEVIAVLSGNCFPSCCRGDSDVVALHTLRNSEQRLLVPPVAVRVKSNLDLVEVWRPGQPQLKPCRE